MAESRMTTIKHTAHDGLARNGMNGKLGVEVFGNKFFFFEIKYVGVSEKTLFAGYNFLLLFKLFGTHSFI